MLLLYNALPASGNVCGTGGMCRGTNGLAPARPKTVDDCEPMRYEERVEAFLRRYGFFILFTATGLLFFGYRYLDDLARQHYGTAPQRFIEEMTGAYAALILMPIVMWLVRQFPWSVAGWPRALVAQVFGLVGFSVAHTTIMAVSRTVLFPIAGLGGYDYGLLPYRYAMEASHDAISYTVIVVLLYITARLAVARRAEIDAVALQGKLAQAKLENLRLQLHPHFLFNTLNAISSVMYEDVSKADAMLVRLSDFLRVILNSTDVPEIPLAEEVQIERLYFGIMKARLETGLHLSSTIDEDAGKAMVPSLLLQPLIENAIEHGQGASRDPLEIAIRAQRSGALMQVQVSDDGAGFTESSEHANGRGRGIANVKSRLSHLYGSQCEFEIKSKTGGGTEVLLTFPYRES
ncbi:MAG: histidine kinase [Candidatus Eremiobacteraeota bacterium]|nr:histidine kinase [Candidatus Eremiobacteraeota bacterium]